MEGEGSNRDLLGELGRVERQCKIKQIFGHVHKWLASPRWPPSLEALPSLES